MIVALTPIWLLVAYIVYRLFCMPRRIENGKRWLIVDMSDSVARGLLAIFWLIVASPVAFMVIKWAMTDLSQAPTTQILVIVGTLAIYCLFIFLEGDKLREVLTAGPGELRVAKWPLPAGRLSKLSYSRHIRVGRPTGEVEAAIELYENVRVRTHNGWTTKQVHVHTIDLLEGEAQYQGKRLEARWRFKGLRSEDPQLTALFDHALAHPTTFDWVLVITLPLEGNDPVNSHFKLEFDNSPRRTEVRRGA